MFVGAGSKVGLIGWIGVAGEGRVRRFGQVGHFGRGQTGQASSMAG